MSKFNEFNESQQFMIESLITYNEEVLRLSERVRDTAAAAEEMIQLGRPGGLHVNANAAIELVEVTSKRSALIDVMLKASGLDRELIADVMRMNRNEFFAAYMKYRNEFFAEYMK